MFTLAGICAQLVCWMVISWYQVGQCDSVSLILTGHSGQVKAVTRCINALQEQTIQVRSWQFGSPCQHFCVGWRCRCIGVLESTLKTTYNLTLINFVIPTYRLTVPHIRRFASSLWECDCYTTICQKSLLYTITLSAMYFWGINMFIIITTPTTITWNQF